MNYFQQCTYLAEKDKDVWTFFITGDITWKQAIKWLKIKAKGIELK